MRDNKYTTASAMTFIYHLVPRAVDFRSNSILYYKIELGRFFFF